MLVVNRVGLLVLVLVVVLVLLLVLVASINVMFSVTKPFLNKTIACRLDPRAVLARLGRRPRRVSAWTLHIT